MGPVFALPLEIQEGTVVEDSELNAFFAQVIGPVIKANPRVRAAKVYLVKSRDFNAYSVAEPEIFIFSQVIERGNLPMVVGILLHELGHAAGHHSMRMEDALRTEKWRHALPALLGAATKESNMAENRKRFIGSLRKNTAPNVVINGVTNCNDITSNNDNCFRLYTQNKDPNAPKTKRKTHNIDKDCFQEQEDTNGIKNNAPKKLW
jgi:hypothetical protein